MSVAKDSLIFTSFESSKVLKYVTIECLSAFVETRIETSRPNKSPKYLHKLELSLKGSPEQLRKKLGVRFGLQETGPSYIVLIQIVN